MNEILGSSIMRLRKENDLTQEQLASGLGITYQAVSKWETGVSCPDIAMLPLLADVFGVSIDELFGRPAPARAETPTEESAAIAVPRQTKEDTNTAPDGVALPWPDDSNTLHVVLFAGHKLVGADEKGERFFSRKQVEFQYEGPALNICSDFAVSCGDVQGDVNAGGDVSCGAVCGGVSAQGDVQCDAVGGPVSAGGDVSCDDAAGSVSAGGDVSCDQVGGNVSAGGDVSCDDVMGSVRAGGDVSCETVGRDAFAAGSLNAEGPADELGAALSGLGAKISDAVNKSIRHSLRFDRSWTFGDRKADIHIELDPEEDAQSPAEDEE